MSFRRASEWWYQFPDRVMGLCALYKFSTEIRDIPHNFYPTDGSQLLECTRRVNNSRNSTVWQPLNRNFGIKDIYCYLFDRFVVLHVLEPNHFKSDISSSLNFHMKQSSLSWYWLLLHRWAFVCKECWRISCTGRKKRRSKMQWIRPIRAIDRRARNKCLWGLGIVHAV